MGKAGDRTGTLAMRISDDEHQRLRVWARETGQAEAALVRAAVNALATKEGRDAIFREDK